MFRIDATHILKLSQTIFLGPRMTQLVQERNHRVIECPVFVFSRSASRVSILLLRRGKRAIAQIDRGEQKQDLTPRMINMEPEHGPLEDYLPLQASGFQVPACLKLRKSALQMNRISESLSESSSKALPPSTQTQSPHIKVQTQINLRSKTP